jgi:pimeloyl-ACP methyl ester carboxylesterase/DNA-binding CsgD family transcriptional regulator
MDRPRIEFFSGNDAVRIAWSVHGSGYPLVRVGTFMTHLSLDWDTPVWGHWNRDLGRRFSYVRYDERGCGSSSRNPPEISVEAWLNDLHGVIEASGFEHVALLGASHAGALAIAYAHRHPDRVSHIVSLGGYAVGGMAPGNPPDEVERSKVFMDALRVFWDEPDDFFRGIWAYQLFPDATPEILKGMEDLMHRSSSGEMASRIFEVRDMMDVRALCPDVAIPTLVVHARNDPMIPFEKSVELTSLLPNASLLSLESAGHLPLPGSEWDRFVETVAEFIAPESGEAGTAVSLSPREHEVLRRVAAGFSNDEIGNKLAISTRTVERHLTSIYRKLELSGRTARAAAAARLRDL